MIQNLFIITLLVMCAIILWGIFCIDDNVVLICSHLQIKCGI
jgi:hypothetical protein